MENQQVKDQLKVLAEKYVNVNKVEFDYYGSGDSFESYDVGVTPDTENISNSEFEDIFWYMIERADSNFNNEGSQGKVTFDLKNQTVSVTDYYNIVSEELNTEFTI